MSIAPSNVSFVQKLQDMLAQIGGTGKGAAGIARQRITDPFLLGGTSGGGGSDFWGGLLNRYGPSASSGGYSASAYTTPFGSTQEAAELGHTQNLEALREEARLAREAGREDLAIRFEQEIWKINRGQQLDLEKIGVQNEYDRLEAEKQRAFAAGENQKGRNFDALQADLQRKFDALESEKGRIFEKEMRQEELGFERQRVFSETMGRDPVRAALYALGVGGEILPGGEIFGGLPPMKGATTYAGNIEQALSQLLGVERQQAPRIAQRGTKPAISGTKGALLDRINQQVGGNIPRELIRTRKDYIPTPTGGQTRLPPLQQRGGIRVGESGVTGLPGVIKSATAYQRGGAPAKTLLESAYGVGATAGKGRPGIIPEETRRMITSVTPRGVVR